jgi:hypothetical protein
MTDGNKAMTRVEMLKAYLSTATTEDELSKLIHDVSRLLSGGHSVGKSILSQSEFVTPEIRQGSKKKSIRVPRGT